MRCWKLCLKYKKAHNKVGFNLVRIVFYTANYALADFFALLIALSATSTAAGASITSA